MNDKNYIKSFNSFFYITRLFLFSVLCLGIFASTVFADQQIDQIKKLISDKLYKTASSQLKLYIIKNPESSYAKLLLGQTLLKSGKNQESLEIFKDFYFNAEESLYTEAAAFYLGQTHFNLGNYPRAIKYYQEIIQNYPKSTYMYESFFGLGNAYTAIKKYQDAESFFNTIISAKEADAQLKEKSVLNLAKLYYEEEKFPKALEILHKNITDKKPNIEMFFILAETYMAIKNYEMAIKYYNLAQPFSLKTNYTEDILVAKGLAEFMISDFSKSAESFKLLIKNTQNYSYLMQAYMLGGESLFRLGDYKKSLKLFTKYYKSAAYNDKNLPKILYFIGENLTKLKQYLSAIKYYKKITEKYNNSKFYPLSMYGIGWANYCSESFLEGIDYLRQAEEFFKNTDQKASAKLLIAESFNKKQDYTKAALEYEDMLTKYYDISWKDKILYRYGLTFYIAKNYKKAINIWQQMQITHLGSHYAALAAYKMAWALYKQGQLRKATNAFNSFIINYPDSYLVPFALLKKANIFYMLNEYPDAIKNYKKITKRYKNSIPADRAGYEIGWCYYLTKGEKFAEKYFDKYLTKNPSSTFKKDILFWIAQNHFNNKDYLFSSKLFKQINKLYETNNIAPRALFWHAKSEALAGNSNKAVNIFQKFIEKYYKHPLKLESTVAIADIFYQQKQYTKASNFYNAIIENYPNSYLVAKCYLKQGDCFTMEKNHTKALQYYTKLASVDILASPAQKAKSLLNIATYHIETNNIDKAISNLIKILYNYDYQTPFYGEAGVLLADLLENKQNDTEGALNIYVKLSKLNDEIGFKAKKNIKRITNNYFIKN